MALQTTSNDNGAHMDVSDQASPTNSNDSRIELYTNDDDYLSDTPPTSQLQHQHAQQSAQQQYLQQQQQPIQYNFSTRPQSTPNHQSVSLPTSHAPSPSPSTSSIFTPVIPANTTASYLPFQPTSQLQQPMMFTQPPPSFVPLPIQVQQPAIHPGILLKIHLSSKEQGESIQTTPTSTKFCPAVTPNRHISNSFYTYVKTSYFDDLKNSVPYKQMNQIGVRFELTDMVVTYVSQSNKQVITLNLLSPLTPETKSAAPNPEIQTHPSHGSYIELNVHFSLKLHKPSPTSYTLSTADRNMMRSFIEANHRTRPRRNTPPPILARIGYQTAAFQAQQQQRRDPLQVQPSLLGQFRHPRTNSIRGYRNSVIPVQSLPTLQSEIINALNQTNIPRNN